MGFGGTRIHAKTRSLLTREEIKNRAGTGIIVCTFIPARRFANLSSSELLRTNLLILRRRGRTRRRVPIRSRLHSRRRQFRLHEVRTYPEQVLRVFRIVNAVAQVMRDHI